MNRSRATKPNRQQTQVSPKPKHVLQAYHEGPLPSPETLRRYDDLVPGTTAIIVDSYQDEIRHRREIEKIQAQSDITHRDAITKIENERIQGIFTSDRLGQIFGFLLALLSLCAAIYFAAIEFFWIASAFLSFPVMGMIKQFLKPKPERTPTDEQSMV